MSSRTSASGSPSPEASRKSRAGCTCRISTTDRVLGTWNLLLEVRECGLWHASSRTHELVDTGAPHLRLPQQGCQGAQRLRNAVASLDARSSIVSGQVLKGAASAAGMLLQPPRTLEAAVCNAASSKHMCRPVRVCAYAHASHLHCGGQAIRRRGPHILVLVAQVRDERRGVVVGQCSARILPQRLGRLRIGCTRNRQSRSGLRRSSTCDSVAQTPCHALCESALHVQQLLPDRSAPHQEMHQSGRATGLRPPQHQQGTRRQPAEAPMAVLPALLLEHLQMRRANR